MEEIYKDEEQRGKANSYAQLLETAKLTLVEKQREMQGLQQETSDLHAQILQLQVELADAVRVQPPAPASTTPPPWTASQAAAPAPARRAP